MFAQVPVVVPENDTSSNAGDGDCIGQQLCNIEGLHIRELAIKEETDRGYEAGGETENEEPGRPESTEWQQEFESMLNDIAQMKDTVAEWIERLDHVERTLPTEPLYSIVTRTSDGIVQRQRYPPAMHAALAIRCRRLPGPTGPTGENMIADPEQEHFREDQSLLKATCEEWGEEGDQVMPEKMEEELRDTLEVYPPRGINEAAFDDDDNMSIDTTAGVNEDIEEEDVVMDEATNECEKQAGLQYAR